MTRSIKNLIAAILIAISGYLAWTEILPSYTVIDFLKTNIEEKKATVAFRTEIIKKIEDLRKEKESQYATLQRLALVLPEKDSIPEIITSVENIYSRSGLILPDILLSGAKSQGQVAEIGLEIGATGTYKQFLTLLDFFERNIRIFDTTAITVGLDKEVGSGEIVNPNDPQLNFSIKGNFYKLQSTKEKSSSPLLPSNNE